MTTAEKKKKSANNKAWRRRREMINFSLVEVVHGVINGGKINVHAP